MPYVIALIGIVTAAYLLVMRARSAAEMTHELADMASDVMAVARRLGFRRGRNTHPVEDIDDPKIAAGGLAMAFLQIGGMPTQNQRNALLSGLQTRYRVDLKEAEEINVLGQWLINQCQGPAAAIPRFAKRLYRLGGTDQLEPMLGLVQDVLSAGEAALSDQQREALDDVKRAFHVK